MYHKRGSTCSAVQRQVWHRCFSDIDSSCSLHPLEWNTHFPTPCSHLCPVLSMRLLVLHLACWQQQAGCAADEGALPRVNLRQLGWLQHHGHTLLTAHLITHSKWQRTARQHEQQLPPQAPTTPGELITCTGPTYNHRQPSQHNNPCQGLVSCPNALVSNSNSLAKALPQQALPLRNIQP